MTGTTPLWFDALPESDDRRPPRSSRADVVIVGGGLTGLSAALHLLEHEPSRRIVVLERDRVGSGASARSTGMLTPGVGQNLAGLVRRFGRERAAAMYRATLDAVRYVEALATREGVDCELRMSGQLVVATGRSGPRRVETLARLMDELGLPNELLPGAALHERLRLAADVGLRLPVAGTLHPGKLVAGLARAVRKRGGEIYERSPVAEIEDGGPRRIVLGDGAEVLAGDVVLAAGGYAHRFGFHRGRVLPLHLHVLVTKPLSRETLATIGWKGREGVIDSRRVFDYFRLTEDDRLLFGGGLPTYRFGGRTESPAGGRAVEYLRRELEATFGGAVALSIERSWSGVIDYVVDTLPVIGRLRRPPHAVSVGGWCGHGIALGVAAGAWVQKLVDGEPTPELPWFRERSPLVPTELLRSVGVPLGTRALAGMDRL